MTAFPVKVGSKGRVVLPAAIRRELGIDEGTELMARVEGDGFVLEPASAAIRSLRNREPEAVLEEVRVTDEPVAERNETTRREGERG